MRGYSSPFARAYQTPANGPFSSGPFAQNLVFKPTLPDGFVLCSEGGSATEESLAIVPFSDAPQGTLFSMRLFYWNRRSDNLDDAVWLAVPLIEVLCSVSNVAGVYGSPHLDNNTRVCDQITLTAGSVGLSGTIYSFGAGSDLPALVTCEIQGARLLSFDFQAVDPNGQQIANVANMNAWWAKFS